ncbi:MAG: dihydropteroate synthase [Bacteroidota bacterium]
MGIINTTTDSFYADSRQTSVDRVLFTAEKMISEGATILDIGGQSTRPGHIIHTEETELKAVLPAIEAISKRFPEIVISIDTYRSKVANYSCSAGASVINDISGGSDPDMFSVAAISKAVYILMHIKGTTDTMHHQKEYSNILTEISDYFIHKSYDCYNAGIKDVILDIGIGFSKSIEENYFLLKNLNVFAALDLPLLIGLSRKSFIYKALGTSPDDALNSTTALNFLSLTKGAKILRVHDVKEAVELVKLWQLYKGQ